MNSSRFGTQIIGEGSFQGGGAWIRTQVKTDSTLLPKSQVPADTKTSATEQGFPQTNPGTPIQLRLVFLHQLKDQNEAEPKPADPNKFKERVLP